ncbi:MAG: peptide chain release factor N(5)-glutamine methyltransferase [Clostridia bacterium]|nr:peptide chain release factor N(5)-glutamine methyltransferase [Clostridia bacterium]
MTYSELCRRLFAAGIENAQGEAAILLEHFCGIDAMARLSDPEADLTSPELEGALQKREARYPLQYILGEWDFYRQTYEVCPDCLIPRSDTEILVEEAIRLLPFDARFADLCTGSGCIAISVLAERPDTSAVALEKFPATLALACRNAERNGVANRFSPLREDLLAPTRPLSDEPLDAILSNPPYIPTSVLPSLAPELSAEPPAALDGGEDGLLFYRAILRDYARYLKPSGFLLLEIGYDQAEALCSLAPQYGFSCVRVLRDYGGQDRVLHLKRLDA